MTKTGAGGIDGECYIVEPLNRHNITSMARCAKKFPALASKGGDEKQNAG